MGAPNGFCSARRSAFMSLEVSVDFAARLRQPPSVNRMSYALESLAQQWRDYAAMRQKWQNFSDPVHSGFINSAERKLELELKRVSRLLREHYLDRGLYAAQGVALDRWARAREAARSTHPPTIDELHQMLVGESNSTRASESDHFKQNWPPQEESAVDAFEHATALFHELAVSRRFTNGNMRLAAVATNEILLRSSLPPLIVTVAKLEQWRLNPTPRATREFLLLSMQNTASLASAFLRDASIIENALINNRS